MSDIKTYPVPDDVAEHAFINAEKYQQMYERSINKGMHFGQNKPKNF